MRIVGKAKVASILRAVDLDDGTIFIFKDDPTYIYMIIGDFIIDLSNNEIGRLSDNYDNCDDREVQEINAHLIIEN